MAAKKDVLLSDAKYFIGFGVTNFVSCMLTLVTLVGDPSTSCKVMAVSLFAIAILIASSWCGYRFYRKSLQADE